MLFAWSWISQKGRRSELLGLNVLSFSRRGRGESLLLGLIKEDFLWYPCTFIFFKVLRVLGLSPSNRMIPPCDFSYGMLQWKLSKLCRVLCLPTSHHVGGQIAQCPCDTYIFTVQPKCGPSLIGEASCILQIAPSTLHSPVHPTSTTTLLGQTLFIYPAMFSGMSEGYDITCTACQFR